MRSVPRTGVRSRLASAVCIALLPAWACAARGLPAFPGAEGFGSDTVGGRGGRVIAVTTLADAGPGSLRAALAADGPRTIVFRTGGTIVLQSTLVIANPYVTVAGQTAPGGGIQIRNDPHGSATHDSFPSLRITSHDVVIRYLRIRPGSLDEDPTCRTVPRRGREQRCAPSGDIRAIELDGGARRVVIDHVSAGWSVDEIVSVVWVEDATIQWSLLAEALSYALYELEDSGKGKGMSFGNKASARRGRYARRISVHHNLFASNHTRNPSAASACADPGNPTDCLTDLRGNVVYNWATMGTLTNNIGGHNFVNVVGNVYKAGPDTRRPPLGILNWTDTTGMPGAGTIVRPYIGGNLVLDRQGSPAPISVTCSRMGRTREGKNRVIDTCRPEQVTAAGPYDAPPVTMSSPEAAYESVLSSAGASIRIDETGRAGNARDTTDRRIVAEVGSGGGRILRQPAAFPGWPQLERGVAPADRDADGMPDAWEAQHGFDVAEAGGPATDSDGDGYTDLEEYLNATDPRHAE